MSTLGGSQELFDEQSVRLADGFANGDALALQREPYGFRMLVNSGGCS